MHVAVVDIGTNSTRLLIADVGEHGVTELVRESTVTRLGQGVDATGRLGVATPTDDGYRFDVHLQGDRETVFFAV